MAQRIKGQEVKIIVMSAGSPETELTDIQNFNFEYEIELLQQAYLGEVADRFDEIFKSVKFDFEMHNHSQDFLKFKQKIVDRAQRTTAALVFNIVCTLEFPNGETPTVTLSDVSFGAIPNNTGSRSDYMKTKISGGCSADDVQF